jgi:hypothetical protein
LKIICKRTFVSQYSYPFGYVRLIIIDDILINQVSELKGKILGCWCKPKPCHGDILVELADKT